MVEARVPSYSWVSTLFLEIVTLFMIKGDENPHDTILEIRIFLAVRARNECCVPLDKEREKESHLPSDIQCLLLTLIIAMT